MEDLLGPHIEAVYAQWRCCFDDRAAQRTGAASGAAIGIAANEHTKGT